MYRRWREPADVERRLEPYGLVLETGRWKVVAGPDPRTFRVDQILRADASEEEFTRPDHFDLAAYWTAYQRDFHDRLYQGKTDVRLAPGVTLPTAVRANGRTEPDGWTVPIESVDHAHAEFLRPGTGVEVLDLPPELRDRIARTVAELAGRHGNPGQHGDD
ncbi:WYL domain-containing protein [Streptomyces sp. NBC_01231]|nr:WYL domain-containing protein [Streptomyces sp. NBC_01231]